jgi:hypothetical protein
MTLGQWVNYALELAIAAGLIGSLLYRARPEKRDLLKRSRRIGCVSGGCLLPLLLLILAFFMARNAADLGGPLFWPILAGAGAAFGFVVATLYFIVFQRKK